MSRKVIPKCAQLIFCARRQYTIKHLKKKSLNSCARLFYVLNFLISKNNRSFNCVFYTPAPIEMKVKLGNYLVHCIYMKINKDCHPLLPLIAAQTTYIQYAYWCSRKESSLVIIINPHTKPMQSKHNFATTTTNAQQTHSDYDSSATNTFGPPDVYFILYTYFIRRLRCSGEI